MTDNRADAASRCPWQDSAVPLYEGYEGTDRHELWESLRERFGQVAPVRLEPDLAAWLLLGYEENLAVLRDWSGYSRDTRRWREIREGRRELGAELRPTMAYRSSALYCDGAEHARLIAPIADALSKLSETRVRKDIGEVADQLIDAFCERGEADLVGDYAALLPPLLINRFFGLEDAYGYVLGHLSTTLWTTDGAVAADAVARMRDYFVGLVQHKRAEPGADVTSWMMDHPAELTDAEMADQLILLAGAGHEPTSNLLGNVLRLLLTDPGVAREYASGGVLLDEVVNHVIWTEPPMQALAARFPTRDVTIDGTAIGAGEPLVIGFAAAHADPRLGLTRHAPDSALPTGHNSAHLMWGAGEHRCPAQPLAQQIVRIGVERLIDRLSGIRLAVDPAELRWRREVFVRGLIELPVSFTPVAAPERPAPEAPAPPPEPERQDQTGPTDLLSRVLRWWRGRSRS
ncbi:cytochrome P450 [Spinactinospora alkalitolerans]|uniref:Cytochrome P450 n=1 Tax=Spinactinospora alkalitolerans TaxID=687207 RepID=A0A852TTJ2_9ACTN|nr:cytochrome P450 [Spinactinospora alkalitolerans]NYE46073.1 cytochrome P450 [Spinactinospora alkalitolerans]